MERKKCKDYSYKIIFCSVVIAVLIVFGQVCPVWAEGLGTATVSVEKFTLGQGYLVEPCQVELQESDNAAKVLDWVLREHGFTYSSEGNFSSSFYLQSIHGADSGVINIPRCISEMAPIQTNGETWTWPPTNQTIGKNLEFPDLGQFAYTSQSGWMYCVNGEFPIVGFSGMSLKDGDVMRVQFTLHGLGADVGEQYMGEGAISAIPVADKDRLTEKVAQIRANQQEWFAVEGCRDAYNNAMKVLQALDSSQEEVNAALAAFPSGEAAPPVESRPIIQIALDKPDIRLEKGQSYTLSVSYEPDNTTETKRVVFSSSREDIATVDPSGKIMAKAEGSTVITARTANGITARCNVTVTAPPAVTTGGEKNDEEQNNNVDTPPGKTATIKLNLKISKTAVSSITLKWSKVPKAEGYKVYRYDAAKKKYVLLETLASSKRSYVFRRLKGSGGSKLAPGTVYKLRVTAYAVKDGKTESIKTETVQTATKPTKAAVKKVESRSSAKVRLAWKKISHCSGYEIYMSAGKNSKYKKVKTFTSNKTLSYTRGGLKKNKIYYFKIRAYKKVGNKKVYGDYSAAKKVRIK